MLEIRNTSVYIVREYAEESKKYVNEWTPASSGYDRFVNLFSSMDNGDWYCQFNRPEILFSLNLVKYMYEK